MRISDWSSDVCSSDLRDGALVGQRDRQFTAAAARKNLIEASRRTDAASAQKGRIRMRRIKQAVIGLALVIAVPAHAAPTPDYQAATATLAQSKQAIESRDLSGAEALRSEEHTSELQSLMRISYADFCLK